jgi:hypothetical protein
MIFSQALQPVVPLASAGFFELQKPELARQDRMS